MNKVTFSSFILIAFLLTLFSCQKKNFDEENDYNYKSHIFFSRSDTMQSDTIAHKIKWLKDEDTENNFDDSLFFIALDLNGLNTWYQKIEIKLFDGDGVNYLEKKEGDHPTLNKRKIIETVRVRKSNTPISFYKFKVDKNLNNTSWLAILYVNKIAIDTVEVKTETCTDGIKNKGESHIDCGDYEGTCIPCYNLFEYNGEKISSYSASVEDSVFSITSRISSYESIYLKFTYNPITLMTEIDSVNTWIKDVVHYDYYSQGPNNYIEISEMDLDNGTISGFFNIDGVYQLQNGAGNLRRYTNVTGKFANLKVDNLRNN